MEPTIGINTTFNGFTVIAILNKSIKLSKDGRVIELSLSDAERFFNV